ncbi:hypothetical protein [Paenibacillus contaminans]|nr:hypothetical protein [Paenibacillus contaminans]
MQNQSFMNNSYQQSQFRGGAQTSQYQGMQKFQPTGFVTSVYGQNQGQSQGQAGQGFGYSTTQYQPSSSYSAYQPQSQQSFHTASYMGNQPGHDSYKRSDSQMPSQSSYIPSAASYGSFGSSSYTNQTSYAPQSAQSFHLANYRGNEQGHDSYLHSDSQTPAQSQYGGAGSQYQPSFMSGSSQYQSGYAGGNAQYQPSFTSVTSQYQPMTSGFAQYGQQAQNQQSFHTANYRGDQQGHDNYLRSDSSTPSSYGMMNNSGFAR